MAVKDWIKPSSNLIITKDDDPKAKLQEGLDKIGHFSTTEPGLVHPQNTSIVKIRDKGIIDIFTGSDQGIRIDPKTKTITMMSDTTTIRSINMREYIDKDYKVSIRKDWEILVKGNIDIKSDKSITIESKDDLTIKSSNGNIILDAYKIVDVR